AGQPEDLYREGCSVAGFLCKAWRCFRRSPGLSVYKSPAHRSGNNLLWERENHLSEGGENGPPYPGGSCLGSFLASMIVMMGMADLRGNLSFKVQRFYGFPGFYTMKRREETKHRLIIGSYKGAGILSKEKRRMSV